MMRFRPVWLVLAVVAPIERARADFFEPGRASQAGATQARFRLGWARAAGAEGCVEQQRLRQLVAARLGRDPFDADAERSIEGVVERRGGRFSLQLVVREADGVSLGERHLESAGEDCSELTEAAVLAVALTIDPNAPAVDPPKRDALEAQEASSTPAAANPPTAVRPSEPSARAENGCSATQTEARTLAPKCPAEPEAKHFFLGARAVGSDGVLPGFAPGAAIMAKLGEQRWQLSLGMTWLPEVRAHDARFSFGLTAAELGACWRALPFKRGAGSLCAEVLLGSQHAVVHELRPLNPGDRAFAAVGLGPEVSLDLAWGARAELGVLALVPVLRPEFVLRGSDDQVFQSRPVALLAFLGLGYGTRAR
ncbi:MAG: hypothetical protein ACOY0T_38490 [Myxococcota bacterium]